MQTLSPNTRKIKFPTTNIIKSNSKGFLWDITTNKQTDTFDPSSVLKVKFAKIKPKRSRVSISPNKQTAFEKYIQKMNTIKSSPKDSEPDSDMASLRLPKAVLDKNRLSPMKIFSKDNDKAVVQYSNKSIYKLANKFRFKTNKNLNIQTQKSYKNIWDVIKEIPSAVIDSGRAINSANKLANSSIPVDVKFNFNLDESSTESLNMSEEYDPTLDDIFVKTNPSATPNRIEEDIKTVVRKRIQNRVLKMNNLWLGDEFVEAMAEIVKKDNNLQQLQLSNNKMSTRGAIATFHKISNVCYFLDISQNPDINRDAYKFLCRYVLKDYRK